MPITTATPENYDNDPDHFNGVFEFLFTPALEGYEVDPPIASGSEVIQAGIIRKLIDADLVLCDVSQLNANVFFELGIRTALDKPVCYVVDDVTGRNGVPFDTSDVNFHEYASSLDVRSTTEEIPKLKDHIRKSVADSDGRNAMWRVFGVAAIARLNPEDSTTDAKLDLIIRKLERTGSSGDAVAGISPRVMAVLATAHHSMETGDLTWDEAVELAQTLRAGEERRLYLNHLVDLPILGTLRPE